jgi:hypothetical protein
MKQNESWRLVEYQAVVNQPEIISWLALQDQAVVHWDEEYEGFWVLGMSKIDFWLHLKGI